MERSMWQVIWRLRLLLWENVLPHLVHLWGRSPVWVTRWICKWLELLVEYGQRLQRCRLTGPLRQRKILFLFLDFRSNEEKRFWYWYNWTPPNKTENEIFNIVLIYNKGISIYGTYLLSHQLLIVNKICCQKILFNDSNE